uniref:Innexin n=1 Tax=Macrostomum lignano TaxID=282301 RepID=A0A1I8HT04_9PLAT
MNFDFLLKANQFRVTLGQHGSAEDFVDVLNYTITPAVLIFLASISASRQYLFTPIQCWSLLELDSQRMEYIENLCWVDNMYFWPLDDTLPKGNEKQREERTIYYYQWVPFVLALQALLFYLPRLAWLCLSDRIGAASLNDTMRFALAAATSLDQDRRHRLIAYLAEHIHKLMRHAQPLSRSRRCRLLTRRTGFALVSAYLLTKAMYICVSLGQLAKFTVQCVLPNNMLNEKIYIFLWFWVFALALLTAASCLSWAVSSILPSSRRALLKKYLRAGGVPPQAGDRSTARRFLRHFLRHDGVFLLRMIGRCAGDLLAADVAREVWRRYRDGQATAAKSWDLRFSGGCPTATAASAAAPLTATMRLAQRQVSGGGAHQLEEDDNGNELGRDDDGNEST